MERTNVLAGGGVRYTFSISKARQRTHTLRVAMVFENLSEICELKNKNVCIRLFVFTHRLHRVC